MQRANYPNRAPPGLSARSGNLSRQTGPPRLRALSDRLMAQGFMSGGRLRAL